jgi:hypothetical protein
MKVFISTILIMTSTVFLGQTTSSSINWTSLIGKWQCTKATRLFEKKTEDQTKKRTPYYCNFSADLKYSDEQLGHPANSAVKTTTEGSYNVDKTKSLITYDNLTQTIKYTDGAYADLVQKVGKHSLKVIKLTDDLLVLQYTESPKSDGPGDYTFYFKKVK